MVMAMIVLWKYVVITNELLNLNISLETIFENSCDRSMASLKEQGWKYLCFSTPNTLQRRRGIGKEEETKGRLALLTGKTGY